MKKIVIRVLDNEEADVSVKVSPEFLSDTGLYKADVLQDAIEQLKVYYHEAVAEAFPRKR